MPFSTSSNYKLPNIDVVRLVPQIPKESLALFRKEPHSIHRLLVGRVIPFNNGDIQRSLPSQTGHNIQCLVELAASTSTECYIAVFSCRELVKITNEGNEYGAVVSQTTQVIFSSSVEKCSTYSRYPRNMLLSPSLIKPEHEQMTFDLQCEEVRSALIGCASSVFASSASSNSSGASSTALRNILLVGPSGSGCTTICQHLSTVFNTSLTIVTYTSLIARRGKEYADLTLQDIIQCALVQQPVVLVLDDLSAIAPRDVKSDEQNQVKVIQVLVNLLQYSKTHSSSSNTSSTNTNSAIINALKSQTVSRLLVVGITPSLSAVDKKLTDLFQSEGTVVHIPLPTAYNRRVIAQKVYQKCRGEVLSTEARVNEIEEAELFSIADSLLGEPTVSLVCSLSQTLTALLAHRSGSSGRVSVMQSPSSSSSSSISGNLSRLSDIAGHDAIKQRLIETIIWPRIHSKLFKQFGVTNTDCGILLFGPPGTGKTLLPSVLSAAFNIHIVNIKISSIVQGEVGSSERAVVAAFTEAKRVAPCLIFIDEFQALFTARSGGVGEKDETGSSLSSTLAQCLDDIRLWNQANMESLVVVIGASNEPWAVDRGFLRSGRLSLALFVGALDVRGRVEYLRGRWRQGCAAAAAATAGEYGGDIEKLQEGTDSASVLLLQHRQSSLEQQQESWIQWVAERCEGFTGADMSLLWQRAARALQEWGYHPEYQVDTDITTTAAVTVTADAADEVRSDYDGEHVEEEEEAAERKLRDELKDLLKRIDGLEEQYIRDTAQSTAIGSVTGSVLNVNSTQSEASTSTDVINSINDFESVVYQSVPTVEHFVIALRTTKASVSVREIEEYLKWDKYERNK